MDFFPPGETAGTQSYTSAFSPVFRTFRLTYTVLTGLQKKICKKNKKKCFFSFFAAVFPF